MSPSPMAPRMASVRACRPASASEWPIRVWSCGISTPHSQTAPPGPQRWASKPWTDAGLSRAIGPRPWRNPRDRSVSSGGHRPRPGDAAAVALDHGGVVGRGLARRARRHRRRSGGRRGRPGRLGAPQAVAVDRAGDRCRPSPRFRRVGDGQGGDGPVRGLQRRQQALDDRARSERAGRRHGSGPGRSAAPVSAVQAGADRIGAFGTAVTARQPVRPDRASAASDFAPAGDHDDDLLAPAVEQGLDRPAQHGLAAQRAATVCRHRHGSRFRRRRRCLRRSMPPSKRPVLA